MNKHVSENTNFFRFFSMSEVVLFYISLVPILEMLTHTHHIITSTLVSPSLPRGLAAEVTDRPTSLPE